VSEFRNHLRDSARVAVAEKGQSDGQKCVSTLRALPTREQGECVRSQIQLNAIKCCREKESGRELECLGGE
jgi:hypothetical protein